MAHLHTTELSKEKKQLLEKAELYHKELLEARDSIGNKVSKNALKWASISIGAILLARVLKSILSEDEEVEQVQDNSGQSVNLNSKKSIAEPSRIPSLMDTLVKPFLLDMTKRVVTNLFVNKEHGDTKED